MAGYILNKNCKFIAIASRTEEHARVAAEKYEIPNIYVNDDWKKMLDDENLDIVSICTPNYLHAPMVLEAIKNDINILCEKPICVSLEELKSVEKKLKNKKNLVFFTVFQKRFITIFPVIKNIIDNNVLGKITLVRYFFSHFGPYTSWSAQSKERWFFDSNKAKGGVFLDLGVHCIDLLRYLIDDYSKIEGFNYNTSCKNMTDEDNCNVIFRFKNDVLGVISVSWCNHPAEIIEIIGTTGSLKLDLFPRCDISVTPNKLKRNEFVKNAIEHEISNTNPLHDLIDSFINCVLEKKSDSPNFEDGKKAVEFCLNAYSLKKHP